jgi:L-fuculose-phosphate aldolase
MRKLRQDLIDVARRLHARGWVANHDGNATARLGSERFLATPTATSKADVDQTNLLEVDRSGARLSGTAKPFGELPLHLAVYAARADVGAVVHAHPPSATAIACAGSKLIERPFIAEAIVSLGAVIPTAPFTMPGKPSADAVAAYAPEVDALLLANHGVITWGANLELAFLRMELVEHLATIALAAQAVGGIKPLADEVIRPLLEKRAKAGLGAAADRAAATVAPKRIVACAPAPHAPGVTVISPRSAAKAADGPDLRRVISEEIARALREE